MYRTFVRSILRTQSHLRQTQSPVRRNFSSTMPHSTGSQFSKSSLPNRVRMLVLETDSVHPDVKDNNGSFGEVLDRLFKKAGDAHDPPLGIETEIKFVVEPEGGKIPDIDELKDVHALLLTGSKYDAHGNDEWIVKLARLLQDVWINRPDIRLSGVCFGHQILCRVLGSKIEPTPGSRWELAHTEIKLSPLGNKLFKSKEGKLHLHQMHQDHVVSAPSPSTTELLEEGTEVSVWGSSDTTGVQGIYIRGRLFTSQGHLGFDEHMVKQQIQQRVDSGSIKDTKEADAAKDKAHWEHDGELVAGAILRFFHGDDDAI